MVMLPDNIRVSDRLINCSIDTVKHLHKRSKPLGITAYVKFDEPKTGISLKDRRLCGELKECVPITARTKRFPKVKNSERKQFPVILDHVITVHKSQELLWIICNET